MISPFDITQFSNIDPREDSLENIKKGLFNIIKNECPIVTDRLYRLYVKSCSIMKVGKQIRKKLNKAISSLMREGLVCFEKESNNIKDKVFYLPNGPSVIVRQRTNRSIEEIPLKEIKQVIDEIRAKTSVSREEEIFREVLDFYGFKRLTKVSQSRFEEALIIDQKLDK